MKTVGEFGLQLQAAGRLLSREVPKVTVTAAAQEVKDATLAEMRRVVPTGRLRNVGSKGAQLNVRYTFRPSGEGGAALVRAVGPWQLVENDLRAHPEIPRGVGGLQRRSDGILDRSKAGRHDAKQRLFNALFGSTGFSGVKPLRTPYGPKYRVNIPIVRGRHPWSHGVEMSIPAVRLTMARATVEQIRILLR